MNWQPIFDEIWNNRAHEDYNGSNSKQRDFLRSWNHTRKPEAETTVEQVADSGTTIGKKVTYDLTDKSEPIDYKGWQKALKYLNTERMVLDIDLREMKENVRRLEVVKREFIKDNKQKKPDRYGR